MGRNPTLMGRRPSEQPDPRRELPAASGNFPSPETAGAFRSILSLPARPADPLFRSVMMTLVRFGSLYINVDRVALIRDLTPDSGDGPKLVRLEFADGHSVDVSANASPLLAWAEAMTIEAPGGSTPT